MQLKEFSDETRRLKGHLDHLIKKKFDTKSNKQEGFNLESSQEEYFKQTDQLITLKRDNEEMASAIKTLEKQNFEYEVRCLSPDV